MKRSTVLYTACLGAFMSMGCSQSGPGGGGYTLPPGSGGSAATQGGSTSTGGSAVATGGSAPAAGGSSSTGGSAPTVTAGSGGSSVVGSGGSSSGGSAPIAGSSSVGGSPAAGGSSSAGGSGGISPEDIIPGLNGYYWEGTCAGSIAVEGHNCPMSDTNPSCPTNGINREKTLAVKGVKDQVYTVNIEVRGVIGTRCYTGGTRASTDAINETGNNNWWYVGGMYDNPTGWWNTYELHVSPSTGEASGDVFYFNGSGIHGSNDCEREATFLVNYKAHFKVKGGGTLTFKIHDQNCKGQQNCGQNPDPNSACQPRTVDLTGMSAMPPSGFSQPPANGTYKPQWMLIGVTSITSP